VGLPPEFKSRGPIWIQSPPAHEPCACVGRLAARQRPTETPSGAITPPSPTLPLSGSAAWVTVRGGLVPGTMSSTVEWCPFKEPLFQDSQNLGSQGSLDMYTLHKVNTKLLSLYIYYYCTITIIIRARHNDNKVLPYYYYNNNIIIIASTNNYRKLYRNVRNSERGTRSAERASLTRDASEPDQWSVLVQEKKIINNEVYLISYIADSTLRWQLRA
jgi:hypothetical protein